MSAKTGPEAIVPCEGHCNGRWIRPKRWGSEYAERMIAERFKDEAEIPQVLAAYARNHCTNCYRALREREKPSLSKARNPAQRAVTEIDKDPVYISAGLERMMAARRARLGGAHRRAGQLSA